MEKLIYVIIVAAIIIILLYLLQVTKKKDISRMHYDTVFKVKKPVNGYYLSYDSKTIHLSKKPKTIRILPCNKGVKIKILDNYVTMSGYDSIYNTEYPVTLCKINKPLFNSFKMKKNKKGYISFQTTSGYYLSFSFETNTISFSKDKAKRMLFYINYLQS